MKKYTCELPKLKGIEVQHVDDRMMKFSIDADQDDASCAWLFRNSIGYLRHVEIANAHITIELDTGFTTFNFDIIGKDSVTECGPDIELDMSCGDYAYAIELLMAYGNRLAVKIYTAASKLNTNGLDALRRK